MLRAFRAGKGFTIIELLIVVIVIGILAAAGLAKYQNFAETSRRKTCLGQLHSIETGLAVWETNNQAFAENAKCAFGFTPRTGRLTQTQIQPTAAQILSGTSGTVGSIADIAAQPTVGGPQAFYSSTNAGPLITVIRDDKIWVCPSGLSRYYNGEIQNVPDDYMDTTGGGGSAVGAPAHGGTAIGLGGRYGMVVVGRGNTNSGATPICNGGLPAGWIGSTAAAGTNTAAPSPQTPFKIAVCLSYGTFATGAGAAAPGSSSTNQGGPVGPDGSTLNRHSARW
ncbi:MAG: prepilin-type N-terminal cleavage/methylation domain-containing protein [Candidatus Wallbacteria bacterium]|nr:prepilin-type N-terminal cleavage/methylation domain-containing protein [Candidatus Wallbacteria bacterium]